MKKLTKKKRSELIQQIIKIGGFYAGTLLLNFDPLEVKKELEKVKNNSLQ